MKKFLIYIGLLKLLILISFIGGTYAQRFLTEEEIKKIDPKEIERQKLERKHGELPEERKIIIEEPLEVKEKKREELIIKKYRPKILYIPITLAEGINLVSKDQKNQETREERLMQTRETHFTSYLQRFTAYCYAPYDYQISIYPILAELRCLLNGELYTMKGTFVPNVQNLVLGFQVREFEYCEREIKLNLMIKMKDSSPNLASHVDRRIIENVLAKSGRELGMETSKIITEHMKPQKRIIISEGIVITEEEEKNLKTELKEKLPYLTGSILIKNLSDELLSFYGGRVPPIFYVNSGETYYVEGSCQIK